MAGGDTEPTNPMLARAHAYHAVGSHGRHWSGDTTYEQCSCRIVLGVTTATHDDFFAKPHIVATRPRAGLRTTTVIHALPVPCLWRSRVTATLRLAASDRHAACRQPNRSERQSVPVGRLRRRHKCARAPVLTRKRAGSDRRDDRR